MLCAYGCRCEIENGKVLVLADKPEVFRCGLRYGRLRFTTETAEECAAILRAHNAGTITADADTTRGLFTGAWSEDAGRTESSAPYMVCHCEPVFTLARQSVPSAALPR